MQDRKNVLVTGGAGFIGSNLCENLLMQGYNVVCLDNFVTGKFENILPLTQSYPEKFRLIVGDICNIDDCRKATQGINYVFHEAALGSVPRSINDPITTNEVNIGGFVNMLVASKDAGVCKFIYAASSSTYGDSPSLPKVEDVIGKPLSPYAITKYANELYADVFSKIYNIDCIGLRYFNVFGKRQDPFGEYAAVIPIFIKKLIAHESPVINGDGETSRDFTYIKNVIQMNNLAMQSENEMAINQIYNTACGERITLSTLILYLKKLLSEYDSSIEKIPVLHKSARKGDILHSQASIDKAGRLLGYKPDYNVEQGLKETVDWYWKNIKQKKE